MSSNGQTPVPDQARQLIEEKLQILTQPGFYGKATIELESVNGQIVRGITDDRRTHRFDGKDGLRPV